MILQEFGTLVFELDMSRKVHQVLGPLLGAAIMAYFAYHGVQGDRGLIAWWNLSYEIQLADADLAHVTSQKELLEHRVSLLRPESLDRDMLEERSRVMLSAIHPKDFIIPDPVQG